MKLTTLVIAIAWLACSGCYTYARTPGPLLPDTEVSLLMSTEAQIRLRDRLGLDARTLDGRIVSSSPDSILIEIPSSGPFAGVGGDPLFQRVDLAKDDVLEARTKTPSPPRTIALLAGVGAGTAVILATQVLADRNPGQVDGNPPGPEDRRAFIDLSWIIP